MWHFCKNDRFLIELWHRADFNRSPKKIYKRSQLTFSKKWPNSVWSVQHICRLIYGWIHLLIAAPFSFKQLCIEACIVNCVIILTILLLSQYNIEKCHFVYLFVGYKPNELHFWCINTFPDLAFFRQINRQNGIFVDNRDFNL